MDWQATEFTNSWRYAFMGLVRKSPEHQDAAACAAGLASWNRHMRILDGQLESTGAYRERLLTQPGFRLHGANGQP